MKSGVVIFSFLLAIGIAVYSCGGGEKTVQGTSGADIYNNNCVVCHGADGKAGMTGATDLSTSVLTHEAAVNVVMFGRNGMRAFNELSKDEVEAVVAHIESLRKK